MTKMTTCLSIILIAGFAMFKLIDIQVDANTGLTEVAERDKKMQEHATKYFAFKDSFEATLLSLEKRELTLADAVERVTRLADRYNPDYFEHLVESEPGKSRAERVAHNLVGHIASNIDCVPSQSNCLAQLEAELMELTTSSRR